MITELAAEIVSSGLGVVSDVLLGVDGGVVSDVLLGVDGGVVSDVVLGVDEGVVSDVVPPSRCGVDPGVV